MKTAYLLVIVSCALLEASGFPYYPYYGNVDSLSYGSNEHGGMAMSRYYNPYYQRGLGVGAAAYMNNQPSETQAAPSSQYYVPDRRRQTLDETNYVPPQQNEVFYPQPESPVAAPTKATENVDPTERAEFATTTFVPVVPVEKAAAVPVVTELSEPEPLEVEEPAPKAKKTVAKKKQVKRPVEDDDEEDEAYPPRMPAGAFFPMFFGWGGRSGAAGGPGGPTAIANAYSTGRGGVATSHATAYGGPRPEEKL